MNKILEKAIIKLTFGVKSVLYEDLVILTEFKEEPQLNTFAGVLPLPNKVLIYISPKLYNLKLDQIVAILEHEYWHILNGHIWFRLKDPFIDNLASDIEINQEPFLDEDLILSIGGCIYEIFDLEKGKYREYYYEKLLNKKPKLNNNIMNQTRNDSNSNNNKNGSNNKNSKNNNKLIDDHKIWNDSQAQNSESIYRRIAEESLQRAKEKGILSEDFIESILAKWKKLKSLEQVLKRIVSKVIRNAFYYKQTYTKVNRRNILLPGTKHNYAPRIILALDTSGSMDKRYLEDIVSVYKWLNRRIKTEMIQCDSEIKEITKNLKTTMINVKGRGGTNFVPVFEYIETKYKNKIDLLIYGTDLNGEFPKKAPPYEVVWITKDKGKVPFGKIIKLD